MRMKLIKEKNTKETQGKENEKNRVEYDEKLHSFVFELFYFLGDYL